MGKLKNKYDVKKKNILLMILLFSMQISCALEKDQNPICHEKAIQQLQKAAEQIVQDANNLYEGQINALLSLKPIVEADCLRLSITNKDEAPKDLNSAIAYIDALNQAIVYLIDLKSISRISILTEKNNDYSAELTESDSVYLNYLLYNGKTEGGCFSIFDSISMDESYLISDLPKWIPEDQKVKIKKHLAWCSKVFSSSIKRYQYWADEISEVKRFTDQKECSFEKKARFIDQNLCIRVKNYDYDWLREKEDDSGSLLNSLDCSNYPTQNGCPYLEVISREKGKVKKKKFLPDTESALSSQDIACGVQSIRVDPKTKQFSLSGTDYAYCFGGYDSFEIEEIYEIRQLKPVIVKINSIDVPVSYRNDAELEGLTNGKTEK